LGLLGIDGRVEDSCLLEFDWLFVPDVSKDCSVFIFRGAIQRLISEEANLLKDLCKDLKSPVEG
jgi:hypothetical protein